MGKKTTDLIPVTVYVTEMEKAIIDKLAKLENRSISNLGKTLFMREAFKKGIIKETGEWSDD